MAQQQAGSEAGRPKKQPYGPGLLLLFGIILLVIAAYIVYDVQIGDNPEQWRAKGQEWKIYFNWACAAVAFALGAYSFILAAIRSKQGVGAAPPEEAPAKQEGESPGE